MNIPFAKILRSCPAKGKAYLPAVLVIAVGVCLLLLPTQPRQEQEVSVREEVSFDLEQFEEKLEKTLSRIEGAGQVDVVLSLNTGSRQILAQDVRRDGDGAGSSTTVLVGQGSGREQTAPLQTLLPEFRGAVAVCPGGGEPRVRLEVTQAIAVLTGLGSDRISVCRGGS